MIVLVIMAWPLGVAEARIRLQQMIFLSYCLVFILMKTALITITIKLTLIETAIFVAAIPCNVFYSAFIRCRRKHAQRSRTGRLYAETKNI